MVASGGFADFLREQLSPLGHVTMRRMFGKTGVFCDGLLLAMVRDDALYFRVDDDNRATFREAEAFPPLNYARKSGSIDLAFWRTPERLFDEPDEFLPGRARGGWRGAAGSGEAQTGDAETKIQTTTKVMTIGAAQ